MGGMADLSKFKHSAWTGVVLPIALAIVSTFPLGSVRVWLLLGAVVAATVTFARTEFAKGRLKHTSAAFVVFIGMAIGVFLLGRSIELHAKAQAPQVPPVSSSGNADANGEQKKNAKNSYTSKPKTSANKPEPAQALRSSPAKPQRPVPASAASQGGTAVGNVTVAPGAVVSIGQQGGQTAGTIINNGPPPKTAAEILEEQDRALYLGISVVPDMPGNKQPLGSIVTVKNDSEWTIGKHFLACYINHSTDANGTGEIVMGNSVIVPTYSNTPIRSGHGEESIPCLRPFVQDTSCIDVTLEFSYAFYGRQPEVIKKKQFRFVASASHDMRWYGQPVSEQRDYCAR
jgi:hypothetical protein